MTKFSAVKLACASHWPLPYTLFEIGAKTIDLTTHAADLK